MSDSDIGPRNKRKRRVRVIEENSSDSSSDDETSSTESAIHPVIKRRINFEDSSSSDESLSSDSIINPVAKRRKPDFGDSSWETESESEITENAANTQGGGDSDFSDGQSEKCPICLIALKSQEIGTPESCDHMFCVECIQEWSKNMNTCPVDRQEYRMILVRKSVDGNIYTQIPVQPPNLQNEENIVEDPTFCEVCGLSDREDRMLLCDGCDLGYHLECLMPPLHDVPVGAWFCSDCSPEDVVDPEIGLYELQLLLDEAHDLERPLGMRRRRASSRLVPRTRHSERVLRQITAIRNNRASNATPDPGGPAATVSSTTSTTVGRRRKKKKRKPRYRTVYQVDDSTGETVAVKIRIKRRKKKKPRIRLLKPASSVKKRLAVQLGICAPRNVQQNVPDVRVPTQVSNLQSQRYQVGIPTLSLFGQREELNYFSASEDEGVGDTAVLRRRAPNRMDVAAMRRVRAKAVNLPDVMVTSSSDVLGSILQEQAQFHSKCTKFSLGKDGKLTMEKSDRKELNNYKQHISQRPTYSENSRSNDSIPSSSGRGNEYGANSPDRSNSAPTSTVETSTSTSSSMGNNQETSHPQDYTQTNLCTIYDVSLDENNKKSNKDEASENNTPRSGTPASESEIDIYSDIETVSTSKADENEMKAPSPVPVSNTPNGGSDDENDSEPDMVIDTEKTNAEPEENTKEETTVTSTVDSNSEITNPPQPVTSSSEIQSQAVQSSNQLFDDKNKNHDEDEDSEDGCPNFSIYSMESITMAKNTDITLGTNDDDNDDQQNNQVGEVSSSPALPNKEQEEKDESPQKKSSSNTALYSDSEDESVVKRGVENSFGISDLRNMTEDISEEERSYTPCLDERGPGFREGIEGLDTEMISDEERNDFDESHDLKTASDGDALEINAKESELDFTRPEDYEEGEIVDKSKNKNVDDLKKVKEDGKKITKKKDESNDKSGNKENEKNNNNNKEPTFKKLSKNNKERNYRDKDRDRSKSREKRDKDSKREKKKEKRKEIERYDVRALIAEKPRRLKDKFGRDIRRTNSRSKTRTPSPKRSLSRSRRSPSNNRRSLSRPRRSLSKRRSLSRGRDRKKKRRSSRRPSASRSKSRSPDRRRSRSKTKKRRRSPSRDRRKKSRERERSKGKTTKKRRSRSRHSRSPTPKRTKEWNRRHSRDWTPSLSRSRTPEPRHLTPSWTPPRIMDSTVKPHNLTVILTNDANKKKKEKKKKTEKRTKETERNKKRRRNERTPPPSKEVFASGDNILVSVSFNKDNETRDVSAKKRRETEDPANKKTKKDRVKKNRKRSKDLTGVKPVAIIDLERSPFKEITPSPKDVIVLSDSDNEEGRAVQKNICDSSQQVASPERLSNSYTTGPKTPPEPQVKFTLTSKQTQMRAISNPLHDPDDIEPEENTQEVEDSMHKGPNTPPEPPNSPPSSPDAYDPFEPTKSRSPTPEPIQTTQSSAINLDDNREDSIMESRTAIDLEKSTITINQAPDLLKSHTPPLADVQPADSQSSIQATPESSLGKSPERSVTSSIQTQTTTSKPIAQTIPFSSVPTSIMTSTPVSSGQIQSRINILNTTIITPTHVVSSIPQRIVLPNTVKSSPVKISPTKPAIKSTPIKPMPLKTSANNKPSRKSNRNQNGNDSTEANVNFDSPYSPGSSDYEDLFEPPAEVSAPKATAKPATKKSPAKIQNAFDALFGSSPFNKIKAKQDANKNTNTNKVNNKKTTSKGTKQVGVKLDEDNLKILDDLPNSAVEMQVKDKFLKKLNRQERVVEEVKLVLKPHYNKKHVNKEEYKDILRRAVPKICHNKSGEINPTKIKNLIEAYVKKVRHSKKVTSSSSSVNPQKA